MPGLEVEFKSEFDYFCDSRSGGGVTIFHMSELSFWYAWVLRVELELPFLVHGVWVGVLEWRNFINQNCQVIHTINATFQALSLH